MHKHSRKKGLTLLELLIVIAIIAILSVVVVLVINPSEILKKSRDSQRISDLNTLKTALGLYKVGTASPKMAGVSNAGCKGTTSDTNWQTTDYIYYSYPSDSPGAVITSKNLDGNIFTTGGAYQVLNSNLSLTNGLGWLPVNLSALPSGSPISNLPIDPVNTISNVANPTSTDLVYRYVCLEKNLKYEIDARLESQAYTVTDNKMAKDGGNNDNYFEIGTDLTIFNSEGSVCAPNCSGKNCGDDGCGGFCGTCGGGENCVNGICQALVFSCGQNFVDSRDTTSYPTVNINGQCWFAKNAAYLPSVAPSATGDGVNPDYYVYAYQGVNVATAKLSSNYLNYGALYNFPAALTACPSGWHLPTDPDWTSLITYLGGLSVSGNNLKALPSNIVPWDGIDTYGFSVLPAGRRHVAGSFFSQGTNAYFWTSLPQGTSAWANSFSSGSPAIVSAINDKAYGFSVRCIKD